MNRKKTITLTSICLFALLLVFFSYWTFLNEKNDFRAHIDMGILLFDSIRDYGLAGINVFKGTAEYPVIISYPIWHFFMYIFYVILDLFMLSDLAAAIASSIVNSFCVVIMYLLLMKYFKGVNITKRPLALTNVVCLSLLFLGPFDVSRIVGRYYLGAYTGNVWHNPTYLIIRPLGFIIFLMYIKLLDEGKKRIGLYVITSILLVISAYLKPSFYQAFLPGLVVYCIVSFLIKRDKQTFFSYLKIAATCIPVALVAMSQFLGSIAGMEEQGGIMFGPLYVWKYYTPNWGITLIASIAFLLITFGTLKIKNLLDTQSILVLCMLASGLLQYALLYIEARPYAADFCWGFELAIFFAFVVGARRLLVPEIIIKLNGIRYVCWITFALHVIFGLLYFLSIWSSHTFVPWPD